MLLQKQSKHHGFTLVEIMIVVAIIALLAALAVPGFLRARKRSQATTLLNNLRLIDAAKDQYAIDYSKTNVSPNVDDITEFFKDGSVLQNSMTGYFGTSSFMDGKISSVTYYLNTSDQLPSIDSAGAFSDVVDSTFWSPYSSN